MTDIPINHDGFVVGDNGLCPSPHRIGTLYVGQGPGRVSRRVAVVRCDCGRRIECDSHCANACQCGAEYGGDGWRLLPREVWGEDTSESFGPGQGPTASRGPTTRSPRRRLTPGEPPGSPSPIRPPSQPIPREEPPYPPSSWPRPPSTPPSRPSSPRRAP